MRVKARNDGYTLMLTIKCGFKEKIDIDMLERFSQKGLPYFLRVSNCKGRKIIYTGIRSISLKEYLKEPITKFDFFFVLAQVVRIIKSAEENTLPLSHISYHLENCFITENMHELQLLYVPIKSRNQRQLPNDFVEAFVYTAKPVDDSSYISDFVFFYRNLSGFNVKAIEKYIAKNEPNVYQTLDGKNVSYLSEEKPATKSSHHVVSNNRDNLNMDETLLGDLLPIRRVMSLTMISLLLQKLEL